MRRSVGPWLHTVVASIAAMPLAACIPAPTLQGFDPPHAPRRALVSVQGENLELSGIIWDAGQPGERELPMNIGGAFFAVPADATPGTHPVAVKYWYAGGRTRTLNFVVDAEPALRIDYPRIDHVMPLFAGFDGGQLNALLYVQGANFDVGAIVEINGTPVATIAHKAKTTDLFGVPQQELGYPIHHYLSVVAVPGPRSFGDELSLVVRNVDNTPSPPVKYKVPSSPASLDSDGDSLLDSWEASGHDGNGDGVNDVDPYRPDILVELDIMDGLQKEIAATTPAGRGALDTVRAMFAAAPFLNPLMENGISLMLDTSGTVPAVDTVIFDRRDQPVTPADPPATIHFSALKTAHFDHAAHGDQYHYVIWAKRQQYGRSGESDAPWPVPDLQPGDDAVIGLDDFEVTYQTPRSQAEILAHELGHNLGQKHGGLTDDGFNPNYWSVMSYAWALRTGGTNVERRWWVTCLPFYYGKAGAKEVRLEVPNPVNMIVDYSSGMARKIIENDGSLDEQKGVCNQEVDWDADGTLGEAQMSVDANDNDSVTDTIHDHANWPALRLDGPSSNGTIP